MDHLEIQNDTKTTCFAKASCHLPQCASFSNPLRIFLHGFHFLCDMRLQILAQILDDTGILCSGKGRGATCISYSSVSPNQCDALTTSIPAPHT